MGYDSFNQIGTQQNYFTWDQLLKVIPKLPDIIVFLQKGQIRNTKFFVDNERRYNPPFLIFSKKPKLDNSSLESQKQLTFGNCNEFENVPHTHELLTMFQDFHAEAFPKKGICMLKKKCKLNQKLSNSYYSLYCPIYAYSHTCYRWDVAWAHSDSGTWKLFAKGL